MAKEVKNDNGFIIVAIIAIVAIVAMVFMVTSVNKNVARSNDLVVDEDLAGQAIRMYKEPIIIEDNTTPGAVTLEACNDANGIIMPCGNGCGDCVCDPKSGYCVKTDESN